MEAKRALFQADEFAADQGRKGGAGEGRFRVDVAQPRAELGHGQSAASAGQGRENPLLIAVEAGQPVGGAKLGFEDRP